MESGKREAWVDIAKAITIIAVVMGHIEVRFTQIDRLPELSQFIYMWHVPVFFMIGGYFLKDERLLRPVGFISGKLRRLYVPTILLYISVILFHNCYIDWGWYDLSMEYGGKYVGYWNAHEYVRQIAMVVAFAGREPLLGAMWFVFVLLFALCGLSLVTRLAKRMEKGTFTMELIRCVLLAALSASSLVATKYFGIMIPRVSNVFTAMWLIYVGMIIKRRVGFTSGIMAMSAFAIVLTACYFSQGVSLNINKCDGIISLTLISACALYAVSYVSQMLAPTTIGRMLIVVGRESYAVMALHLIGFKVCSMIICKWIDVDISSLMAQCGNSVAMFCAYLTCGVGIPIVMARIYRWVLMRLGLMMGNR